MPNQSILLPKVQDLAKEKLFMLRHGRILDYINTNKLQIYLEHVPLNRHPEYDWHDHDFIEVALVLNGSALHHVNNEIVPIKAGDVLMINKGIFHCYSKICEFELMNLTYDNDSLPIPVLDAYDLPLFFRLFPVRNHSISDSISVSPVLSLPTEEVQILYGMFKKLANLLESKENGIKFKTIAFLMEIFIFLLSRTPPQKIKANANSAIGSALQFINQNLYHDFSLSKLASCCYMSERTFFRYFKNYTGFTPYSYLLNRRLQSSISLLKETNKSIGEIALQCGFCDSNHFTKKFTNAFQISPFQYRKKLNLK